MSSDGGRPPHAEAQADEFCRPRRRLGQRARGPEVAGHRRPGSYNQHSRFFALAAVIVIHII